MMVEKVLKRFEEEVKSWKYTLFLWIIFRAPLFSITGASEISSLEAAGAAKVGGAEPSPRPRLF